MGVAQWPPYNQISLHRSQTTVRNITRQFVILQVSVTVNYGYYLLTLDEFVEPTVLQAQTQHHTIVGHPLSSSVMYQFADILTVKSFFKQGGGDGKCNVLQS